MDGEKKVRNSNNGQHLLKPWFVYISQAFSVIFTVIPLPHLIRKEIETNTWSHYPGLFLSKGQAFSTALSMPSLCLRTPVFPVPALCPSTETWNPKGDKQMLS